MFENYAEKQKTFKKRPCTSRDEKHTGRYNSRVDIAEEKVTELKNTAIERIKNKMLRKKRVFLKMKYQGISGQL